jgi:hypothetical protein
MLFVSVRMIKQQSRANLCTILLFIYLTVVSQFISRTCFGNNYAIIKGATSSYIRCALKCEL